MYRFGAVVGIVVLAGQEGLRLGLLGAASREEGGALVAFLVREQVGG